MARIKYSGMAFLLVIAFSSLAAPAINVGSMNEFIYSGSSTLAKRVYNSGDSTAFVKITVDEIVYEGRSKPIEKKLDGEALINGKGTGLLASPPRMIIPVNGMQTSRLVFSGERNKERYYRVRYIPVDPKEMQDISGNEGASEKNEIDTGLKVLTGFGIIVTVAPASTVFNTVINGKNNSLKIENKGNSSVVLGELKYCDDRMKTCSDPENIQLRPGKKIERTAPLGQFWFYSLAEGNKKQQINTTK